MSQKLNTTQAAIDWVNRVRQYSPRLEDEADALLMQLSAAALTSDTGREAGCCIGLLSHSPTAKLQILKTLYAHHDGDLHITLPGRTVNYQTSINPDHAPASMVLRFTQQPHAGDKEWPLHLRLINEAGLVQIFILLARAQPDHQEAEKSVIDARLAKWQRLRQHHPAQGLAARDVAAVAHFWREGLPVSQQQIDDTAWQHLMTLLPTLDLPARADIWALLWGDNPSLTQQWRTLINALHQIGYTQELVAPLSLLIDSSGLPTTSYLSQKVTTKESTPHSVVVCPITNRQRQAPVHLPLDILALLTRELVFTTENPEASLPDLLDIPGTSGNITSPLWQAKLNWLPEYYRQQRQPDALLICQATGNRARIPAVARLLLRWISEARSLCDTALPGVIRVNASQSEQAAVSDSPDDVLQQLTGKQGVPWRAISLTDKHRLRQLATWLPAQRQARLRALQKQHQQKLRDLMLNYIAPDVDSPGMAESVIRRLQAQISRLGEIQAGLLPPVQQFERLFSSSQRPCEETYHGVFDESVDIFAEPVERLLPPTLPGSGHRAHRMWLNHVRLWCRDPDNARRCGLEVSTLRQLADIIITTSYRLELPLLLQSAAQHGGESAAQLHTGISNFITWLGWVNIPEYARPVSRVQKGRAIFSAAGQHPAAALSHLGEQPVHAVSQYAYDWLVALYTRATENRGYQPPVAISDADRLQLRDLLS